MRFVRHLYDRSAVYLMEGLQSRLRGTQGCPNRGRVRQKPPVGQTPRKAVEQAGKCFPPFSL